MNKYSIFYTITFVFIIATVCVVLGLTALIRYDKEIYTQELNARYSFIANARLLYFSNMISEEEFLRQTKNYSMELITKTQIIRRVMRRGEVLARARSNLGLVDIINYRNDIYLKIIFNGRVFLYKDKDYQGNRYFFIKLFGVSIVLILLILYAFVIKKLRPLSLIKRQIAKFGENKLNEIKDLKLQGHDEISELSKAFYEAITRIEKLNDSRKFFLRNIMHELKTPITKGLITLEMLDESKYSQRLQGIFARLEILINELAAIEQITSGQSYLSFKKYNILDLLDEAKEIAMRDDKNLQIAINDPFYVSVDFKLFTTAMKNMIDNAIKHSNDERVSIQICPQRICFLNHSKPLDDELGFYTQAFSKGGDQKDSFGLGLYIVDTILKAHNLRLGYEHKDGVNCFSFEDIQKILAK